MTARSSRIRFMSESSLPFFASLRSRAGTTLSRLFSRAKVPGDAAGEDPRGQDAPVAPALESRAAGVVREYLRSQVANLERAERLGERAERLEKAGIPSESARNRAERAREEVMAGLTALRGRFVEAVGSNDGARAFDRVVDLLCPTFKPLY